MVFVLFYKVFCMYDSLSIYTIIAHPCKIELPSFLHFYWYTNPLAQMPKALIIIHDHLILACVLGHHSAAKSKDLGNWKM